jgi:hypothetical protein
MGHAAPSRARIAASTASLRSATAFALMTAVRLMEESGELIRRSRELRRQAAAAPAGTLTTPPDEPPDSELLEVLDMITRLHRAGWSVGDCVSVGPSGRAWLVDGHNGENLIRAEGRTAVEAWRQAVEQARAVGMLGT